MHMGVNLPFNWKSGMVNDISPEVLAASRGKAPG